MTGWVVDTHALIWYLEDSDRLGQTARNAFDACDRGEAVIYVPTICLVELVYLCEKGRVPTDLLAHLENELRTGGSGLQFSDLSREVASAVAQIPRNEVPDLPDRVIAATALHLGLPLISRDRKIRLSEVDTIW